MSVTPETIAVPLGVTAPEVNSITWRQWSQWIADATMLIQNRAEKLDIDLATIGEAKLDYVIREAVVAQVKKPDDATQVTVSVDDASTSRSYRSGKGRGRKTITATAISPHCASGCPSTAHSATSGWPASRCSISAG